MQNIVLFLLLLPFAQEEKVWDCTEAAVRITAPAHWVAEKELRPGERTCTFTLRTPENLDVSITLVAWDEMGGVPARTLWKKRPPLRRMIAPGDDVVSRLVSGALCVPPECDGRVAPLCCSARGG